MSADLARAVELLLPAGACTEAECPNLVAWQRRHARLGAGESVAAVFAAALTETGGDRYVAVLLEAALAGPGRERGRDDDVVAAGRTDRT